jgi:hypothetical protein
VKEPSLVRERALSRGEDALSCPGRRVMAGRRGFSGGERGFSGGRSEDPSRERGALGVGRGRSRGEKGQRMGKMVPLGRGKEGLRGRGRATSGRGRATCSAHEPLQPRKTPRGRLRQDLARVELHRQLSLDHRLAFVRRDPHLLQDVLRDLQMERRHGLGAQDPIQGTALQEERPPQARVPRGRRRPSRLRRPLLGWRGSRRRPGRSWNRQEQQKVARMRATHAARHTLGKNQKVPTSFVEQFPDAELRAVA